MLSVKTLVPATLPAEIRAPAFTTAFQNCKRRTKKDGKMRLKGVLQKFTTTGKHDTESS